MKSILVFAFLTIAQITWAQAYEKLIDRLDKDGKKDGWWMVFLDENWKEVDESKAVYRCYTWYIHGQNMYLMCTSGKKGWKLMNSDGEVKPVKGIANVLDGEYKWIRKDGKLGSVHKFNKGWYTDCKKYNKRGQLQQHVDYSKKTETNNTFLLHQYNKKGKGTHYMWRDGNKGWTFYYLSSDKAKNK
jgi:hypothetical protein